MWTQDLRHGLTSGWVEGCSIVLLWFKGTFPAFGWDGRGWVTPCSVRDVGCEEWAVISFLMTSWVSHSGRPNIGAEPFGLNSLWRIPWEPAEDLEKERESQPVGKVKPGEKCQWQIHFSPVYRWAAESSREVDFLFLHAVNSYWWITLWLVHGSCA